MIPITVCSVKTQCFPGGFVIVSLLDLYWPHNNIREGEGVWYAGVDVLHGLLLQVMSHCVSQKVC